MKDFLFKFDLTGGVNDETTFTIAFNATPFVPAVVNRDPDDCHDAEGGEIEDLTVFVQEEVKGSQPVMLEVPEYLWGAFGLDRESLIEKCQEHVKDADEVDERDARLDR